MSASHWSPTYVARTWDCKYFKSVDDVWTCRVPKHYNNIVDVRLKTSPRHAEELDSLLNTWAALHSCDQTFLIEALEQMTMTPQKSTALIKALQQISSKVQIQNEHVHALLFSDTKLLSWYSSKGAFQMTSEDILVLMILCQKTWPGQNLRELQKKRLNYVKLGEAPPVKGVSESETESEESDWTSTGFSSSTENLFDEFEYLAELGEELEDENPKNVNKGRH